MQTLQGFRDYTPAEMRKREYLIACIKTVYERFGFEPIDTPALEYAELLMGKYGEDEKLIYHFQDHGDRHVALRYDLTVPLARFVANHPELPKPFKRYHVAPVWRADSPQKGRLREFKQFDADIIGSSSPLADAEILIIMTEIMKAIDVSNYAIKVNHRGVINGMLRNIGVLSKDIPLVMRTVDKIAKIGPEKVKSILSDVLEQKVIDDIMKFIEAVDEEVAMADLTQLFEGDVEALAALQNLKEILSILPSGVAKNIRLDLSIMRGLDYYTGLIYETYLTSGENVGGIIQGGRYDNLMNQLAGVSVPAIGTSFGVDRMLAAIGDKEIDFEFPIFMPVFPGLEKESVELAQKIRDMGINVSLSAIDGKIGKQMQYANSIGAKFVLLYGEEEVKKNIVQVRNMLTGEQSGLDVKDMPALVDEINQSSEERSKIKD